jgi:uncharacterized membrane protein (UPF0127 family)
MMRATSLLLALVGLLPCAACETQRPTSAVAVPVEQEPKQGAPAAPDKPVTAPVQDGVGNTCFNDLACKGYLRCVNRACAVPGAITGQHDDKTPRVKFRAGRDLTTEPHATFYVELAVQDSERERGLMYRRSMQDDWGMLFIYPADDYLSFWMKNTYIPLDMLFVHSSGQIACIIEGAEPLTLEPRSCNKPARYVLELKAGTARARGIKVGDWMDVAGVAEEQRPLP